MLKWLIFDTLNRWTYLLYCDNICVEFRDNSWKADVLATLVANFYFVNNNRNFSCSTETVEVAKYELVLSLSEKLQNCKRNNMFLGVFEECVERLERESCVVLPSLRSFHCPVSETWSSSSRELRQRFLHLPRSKSTFEANLYWNNYFEIVWPNPMSTWKLWTWAYSAYQLVRPLLILLH